MQTSLPMFKLARIRRAFRAMPLWPSATAFSLPELLLVIAVFSAVSTASYPIFNNISAASAYHKAEAKAEALTAAKILYHKSDANAAASWNAAADEAAQFTLLKPFLTGIDSEDTLDDFAAAAPYNDFDLGNTTRDPVSIVMPD